jgi:hypothetical protein
MKIIFASNSFHFIGAGALWMLMLSRLIGVLIIVELNLPFALLAKFGESF